MVDAQFRRARTVDQREQRRGQILDTTRTLLSAHRVADVSLNEVARQVGLAKSNVLRYFGSREAILLTLLVQEYHSWVDDVEASLQSSQRDMPDVARLLARTALRRPLMCELLSCTTTVLEYNVTVDEVIAFKVAMYADMGRLITALQDAVRPRVIADPAITLVSLHAGITEVWAISRPSPALVEAARQDERIYPPPMSTEKSLTDLIALTLRGATS